MRKNSVSFNKFDILLLFFIILIALVLRLYKINTPLADFHSWRQVDTAAVARNFVRDGFDLLHPKYDDISSSSTGADNPQGYRMVEFPLYNATFAYLYKIFPAVPLEQWGRLTSIFFSLIIIAVIYYFCLKEIGRLTAIISSLVYAVFPFFVFFSRTVLPETMAVATALLAIFFLYLRIHCKNSISSILLYIISLIFFSLSLLIKPTTIFFAIPILYLFIRKYRWSSFKHIDIIIYFLLAAAPVYLWRNYIKAYPQGIPPSEWLIYKVNTYEGQKNIFFRPAFFRWLFFERINNYILGGYLTFLFIAGIVAKPKSWFFHIMGLSALTYLLVFQGGNVQHEYYQVLILPVIALFIGIGVDFIFRNTRYLISQLILVPLILLIFSFAFFFSYYKIRDFYIYPNDLIQIAKVVSTLTNQTDKIITERSGDTTLLYLIDRKGAPGIYKNVADYRREGYKYLVTSVKTTIDDLKQRKFQIKFEDDKFTLFQL